MNPELERNLWLELGSRRLIWTGVVLALIYGTMLLATADGPPQARSIALQAAGLVVFFLCAVIWAGRAAGASVLTEIAQRTWDFQRLSALTPWAMTWGKLVGATSLAALAGASGLVVYGLGAAFQLGRSDPYIAPSLIALAVLVSAGLMAAALLGVRKARAEGRVAQSRAVLSGVVIGVLLLAFYASSSRFTALGGQRGFNPFGDAPARWWGGVYDPGLFVLLSLIVFAAWALVGAWRLMRLELQMRNGPLVWSGFVVFAAVWFAGLGEGLAGQRLVAGAAICGLLTYAAAFAEPADAVRLRGFFGAVQRQEWRTAAFAVPAALVSLAIGLVAVLAGAALLAAERTPDLMIVPFAWLVFVLRDLGVVVFFRFGPRPQRGDIAAVVALAVLYGVLGFLSRSAFGPQGGALTVPDGGAALVSVISGGVQAAIVWVFAVRRIAGGGQKATTSQP